MEELWGESATGRIIVNIIWGVSIVVALYLLYIAYKKLMILISTGKIKKVTVSYANLLDVNPPYAKGEIQFGFELPDEMEIDFRLVDKNDKVLFDLKKGKFPKGVYPVMFDTKQLVDGEYYYQIISDVQKTTKKFFIVNNVK